MACELLHAAFSSGSVKKKVIAPASMLVEWLYGFSSYGGNYGCAVVLGSVEWPFHYEEAIGSDVSQA